MLLKGCFRSSGLLLLPALVWLQAGAAWAQLSLYSTVDLARRNSAPVRIAQADVARAQAAWSETRDAYVPSLTVGSGAGYSYGFQGGVPSVFNTQVQSLAVSFSQPDYIRAAKASLHTATLNLQDALDQVELDAALDYIQLSTVLQQVRALEEEEQYAERLQGIERDRLSAGVESQIAATRAELTAAQADLKRLDLLAQAEVLRKRLSDLTGLAESELQPEAGTIPQAPAGESTTGARRTAGVDAGYSNAVSKHYLARGDARVNYRPQIGFVFSYQLLDTQLNRYNQYYRNLLQTNNFAISAQLSLPLFNAAQAAHARASDADAVHADEQAVQGRQTAEQQVSQLHSSFPELRAQARVADLQAQLASQQLQAVLLQLASAPANPNSAPLTPADEMGARINERIRFSDALDAHFLLLKAQLSLLRATGELAPWINRGAR